MRFILSSCALLSTVPAFIAAYVVPSASKAQVYDRCSEPGTFALTFDDGPYQYSWKLANSLHEQGIPATFFINGDNWVTNFQEETVKTPNGDLNYYQVLKAMSDMGHQIGSHTYQHKNLRGLGSEDSIREQMTKNEDIIKKAIGKKPIYMRPPEGDYDDTTLSVLGSMGYKVIIWDIDPKDWRTHNLASEQKLYKSVLEKADPKNSAHIALEHDVYDQTVDELVPWVIKYVKSKGYRFTTVAECLGESLESAYTD